MSHANPAEYVRPKPCVLDSMNVVLKYKEHPGKVYEKHVTHANSLYAPHDEK